MNDMFDPFLDRSPRARLKRLAQSIVNSRFLLIALILHLVLFAYWTHVSFQLPPHKEVGIFMPDRPPFEPKKIVEQETVVQPRKNQSPNKLTDVTKNTPPSFKPPSDFSGRTGLNLPDMADSKPPIHSHQPGPLPFPGPRETGARNGPTGPGLDQVDRYVGEGKKDFVLDPHDITKTRATFKCFVAQYQEGDWNCNLGVSMDGRWYGNCMVNLSDKIADWTQGRVKAQVQPKPLRIADREWLEKDHPPFIFITGHKNFHFTEAERANLREYLMLGGFLWVDNSLPGRKSRFDEAVRREMKIILPDRHFDKIGTDHPIYGSYFKMKETPAGMNNYQEPVEAIKIHDEIAVFYTLNAYSDLWETALDKKDQPDMQVDWSPTSMGYYNRTGPHYDRGGQQGYAFFRNVTPRSINDAYKFGINIVFHLITRYEMKARDFHPVETI